METRSLKRWTIRSCIVGAFTLQVVALFAEILPEDIAKLIVVPAGVVGILFTLAALRRSND